MMTRLTLAQEKLYNWIVKFIQSNGYPPTLKEIQNGMGFVCIAPVQSVLRILKAKGYINWIPRQRRSIYLCQEIQGIKIPILGRVLEEGNIENYPNSEYINICVSHIDYALCVVGESMKEACIGDGDYALMQRVANPSQGKIVAAYVEGFGTTLKYFFHSDDAYGGKPRITLKPANRDFCPVIVDAELVQIQGVLAGIWRDQR